MNIKKMIYKDKASKETFWALIAKAMAVLGGFFILIFVPKYGGIENYGSLTLFLAYISVISIFFGNSINLAVKKEIAKHKFEKASYTYFSQGIKLKAILFIISTILFLIIVQFLDIHIIKDNLPLFLILLFVMSFWGLIVTGFEASHRLFYVALMYFFEYAAQIGMILYLYLTSKINLTSLIYTFIISYSISLIFGYILFHIKFKRTPSLNIFHLNLKTSKKILIRTFFLSLTTMSLIIMTRISTIMISFFLDIKKVGFYNMASDICLNATVISTPLILGVLPLFIKRNTRTLFNKTIKKLIIVNFVLFVFFLLFSDSIVKLIYGTGFESVGLIIKILGLLPLLAVLQNFTQEILILKDKTKEIFIFSLLAVVINIVLNFILIQAFNITGAAIATATSYLIWFLLSYQVANKNLAN